MVNALLARERQIVLENISWETYERLLREVGERHIRMTYDDGDLEIMTLSFGHEYLGEVLGLFVSLLTLELNIPIRSGGSTTLRKRLKRKGLEPDKCYWIKHEKSMRDKTKWDARKDPPPDLAIEVDIAHSSMNRMGIYASLKIPEVWRYKTKKLRVYVLRRDGTYEERESSPTFPYLDLAQVNGFLNGAAKGNQTALMREFTKWVRKSVAPLVDLPRATDDE
jgi:Uma2 family endonuclease